MAGRYKVVYNPGLEESLEGAVVTAAEATDEHHKIDVLLSTIEVDTNQQKFNNIAMSLSTIFGLNDYSLSAEGSEAALADLARDQHDLKTLVLNNA